jgi:hypothetical protein
VTTITTTDLIGYFASTMVLLAFITKEMRLLRLLAIAGNVAFIAYGTIVWLPPVLCLHLLLLPVNAVRLYEVLKLDGQNWRNAIATFAPRLATREI